MSRVAFRFEDFRLDPDRRQLLRDGAPVELNARYLDALVLLVRAGGALVSKARFLEEVWRGVPVTDEALTQCIRTLRRQLGDDAARPRFIQTVPKHGYRFIAAVTAIDLDAPPSSSPPSPQREGSWPAFFRLGRAGMIGGGSAGLLGGLAYALAGVTDPLQPVGGGASALLVVVCLTALIGLIGGAGVGFGVAASIFAPGRRRPWAMAGGAAGGLVVGAVVKLVGLDAFDLLFGQSPGSITGAPEGALLGAAIGVGGWLATLRRPALSPKLVIAVGGLSAGFAGALIPLLGGRLMGGSLALLAERFPASRLSLDQLGALFGEARFGPISQSVTAGLEGLLFGACVVAALTIAWRRMDLGSPGEETALGPVRR